MAPRLKKRLLHAEQMNTITTRTLHTIPKCKWQILRLLSAHKTDTKNFKPEPQLLNASLQLVLNWSLDLN